MSDSAGEAPALNGEPMPDAGSAPEPLPPLSAEDLALTLRHPMPGGVADAIVNKKLLAHALDVSATTLDSWIVSGLPFVRKGTNGQSYEFRLSVCYAWAREREAGAARAEAAAQDAAAQMRLALLGGSVADESRARLSPREHEEALRVEVAAMKAAELRRDLIRASEVADAFEVVFSILRDGLDAAPDILGRELSLSGAGIVAAQKIFDGILARASREVAEKFGLDPLPEK